MNREIEEDGVLDLLICNGIEILDHYSNSIESHPKDI